MVEHRRLKRQLLRYYLWVFNKEDSLLIGHVGDITTEGVMLVSKELIEVGKIIQFRMKPFRIETSRFEIMESREVECTGTCVWSEGDMNPGFYIAGFKLDKLKEKEKEFICKLISEAEY
ncbi:MAG: PilZ domain-containing protein [Candidatus Brocadiales bacterium]|nr:PilZ domain-containing protein [Candidatus Brocadiales bacterium]